MSTDQQKLTKALDKARTELNAFSSQLSTNTSFGLADQDSYQLLTSLVVALGAQLEAIELIDSRVDALSRRERPEV